MGFDVLEFKKCCELFSFCDNFARNLGGESQKDILGDTRSEHSG